MRAFTVVQHLSPSFLRCDAASGRMATRGALEPPPFASLVPSQSLLEVVAAALAIPVGSPTLFSAHGFNFLWQGPAYGDSGSEPRFLNLWSGPSSNVGGSFGLEFGFVDSAAMPSTPTALELPPSRPQRLESPSPPPSLPPCPWGYLWHLPFRGHTDQSSAIALAAPPASETRPEMGIIAVRKLRCCPK